MKIGFLRNLLFVVCAVCLFSSAPVPAFAEATADKGKAVAIDLQQARASGAIGEKTDGYVAVITNTPEVNAFVAEVNAKRKQHYEQIAKETGQSAEVTAKIASQEIIAKLPVGSTFMNPAGAWVKKEAVRGQ